MRRDDTQTSAIIRRDPAIDTRDKGGQRLRQTNNESPGVLVVPLADGGDGGGFPMSNGNGGGHGGGGRGVNSGGGGGCIVYSWW